MFDLSTVPVVIVAGGLGTRLKVITNFTPKSLVVLNGKPILYHQLSFLQEEGFRIFYFSLGYGAKEIINYLNDLNEFSDCKFNFLVESEPLGSGGFLFNLKDYVKDDFFLINGDLLLNINMLKLFTYHIHNDATATITTHPNSHPYDSAIVEVNERGIVTGWSTKDDQPINKPNLVNSGLHVFSSKIFSRIIELSYKNLDKDILKPLITSSELYSYKTTEYIYDIGTPDRLNKARIDLINSAPIYRRLDRFKQKAIFLDRDGTINFKRGYITDSNQIELIPDVAESIRIMNDLGYFVIIVTNQPVIARGDISIIELKKIHNRIEYLLGQEKAYIDDIFYCPHHPDSGFKGEIKSLKIYCECRKPSPGLFLNAIQKYNIDESVSYGIGDSIVDLIASNEAGVTPVLISKQDIAVSLANFNYKFYYRLIDFARELKES